MSAYVFENPLIRGTMLKRKSQFTALVDIGGEELTVHIPTTNRIGDVENKNLPCLLSFHDDPRGGRKWCRVLGSSDGFQTRERKTLQCGEKHGFIRRTTI